MHSAFGVIVATSILDRAHQRHAYIVFVDEVGFETLAAIDSRKIVVAASPSMPNIGASAVPVVLGDFSYFGDAITGSYASLRG